MMAVGVDPDTKATGIAVVQTTIDGPRVVEVASCLTSGKKFKDRHIAMGQKLFWCLTDIVAVYKPHLLVIEWQAIRPGDPRPNDILNLATVAGMALAAGAGIANIQTPLPVQWRGSIPKEIVQERILKKVDITLDSVVFCDVRKRHKNHIVDAIGLAAWGMRPQ